MSKIFLSIYDSLSRHRLLVAVLLLLFVGFGCYMASTIHYEEDISKFLPRNEDDKDFTEQYEKLSNESRIAIIVTSADTLHPASNQTLGEAKEYLEGLLPYDTGNADMGFIFQNMPYMLTQADYVRMDSLLRSDGYMATQLQEDKMFLMMPTGGMAMAVFKYDPLHLFTPVLKRIQPDDSRQIISFESPYGASETQRNAVLADSLNLLMQRVQAKYPSVRVSAVGGPLIAVANAHQIKTDSMLAVAIASVLILLLLVLHYRRLSDILWIGVSLAFGAIFAITGMALLKDSVSIIVLGIGSVIIGIAVNYPLHYLDHLREVGDRREALREMVPPLLIGNVTTVAAFLCLVFLDAQAMRDLGLFGGLMLVGTILFVLVFLPVFVANGKSERKPLFGGWLEQLLGRLNFLPRLRPFLVPAIVMITIVMGYFSLQTSFDANLQNINYMTPQQRADMQWLTASTGESLMKGDSQEKARQWNLFWKRHAQDVEQFERESKAQGFSDAAFRPFVKLVQQPASGKNAASVGQQLVKVLNDSFNYIGFVCSFVVFFFLWFSFRRLELSLLSFLPLAVGWLWILGMMHLLGVQFNIVNVILATFIFGQGDDYTIFITEGLLYEYATGHKRLASYKRSVVFSAVLMFIGMGTLVFAKHPALQSLGAVTIIGMGTVVFVAYILPPVVFRWMVRGKVVCGDVEYRKEGADWISRHACEPLPHTLRRLGYSFLCILFFMLRMMLVTIPLVWLRFRFGKVTEAKKMSLHCYLQRKCEWIIHHVPMMRYRLSNIDGETFDRPAVVIANHQSHFDLMCLMALSPKMIFLTNDWAWRNPLYGPVIHRAEFYPVSNGIEANLPRLRNLYERGYSICIFPEGTRTKTGRLGRFHKGAFFLARELGADVLPIYIHGLCHVLPKPDFMLRPGSVYVEVGKRWKITPQFSDLENTREMSRRFKLRYAEICKQEETEAYWKPYRQLANYYKVEL